MDDIRRPQPPVRRDYALPADRPPTQFRQPAVSDYIPTPATPPVPAHPAHHHSQTPYHQPVHHAPAVHQSPQPLPAAHPQPAKNKKRGKMLSVTAGVLLTAAAIFGAGWMLKGTSSSQTIPQSITRQVNFSLYFPAPMPPGYTYMKDTATFQIGQVYYKFASGAKRVTVMEQPMPAKKPDLGLMSGYSLFNSAVGKAAVGDSFGQPAGVVLTPTTVITFHTVGNVSQQELKTAINNLKNIGQNPKNS
jgi:hypothetical protein